MYPTMAFMIQNTVMSVRTIMMTQKRQPRKECMMQRARSAGAQRLPVPGSSPRELGTIVRQEMAARLLACSLIDLQTQLPVVSNIETTFL